MKRFEDIKIHVAQARCIDDIN